MSKKTLLIIDDHPLFREGLKSIIAGSPVFKVVGEAGNEHEALKAAKKLKPDLVVMDVSMPGKSGIQLTGEIRALLPATQVMIVSMHARIDYIVNAFRAGAMGYVVKESAADKLLQGLETISEGGYFLDDALSFQLVERLIEPSVSDPGIEDAAYGDLTRREQEVMRLLAEGLTAREIAGMLHISHKTVENHRANIMNKLHVHTTVELVHYAVKLGLIELKD